MAKELKDFKPNVFLPSQFSNENNVQAHFLTTGPEIWEQFRMINRMPDAFVAGVGTGGTVMGVGKFLKIQNPAIKVHPLEPSNAPVLSSNNNHTGHHRIAGISDEFIPSIVKLENLNEIISVDDGDAIIMSQHLAFELGISCGISSGANFLAAIKVQNEMFQGANVVTVFADDNKKYLSTDLLRTELVKPGFLSSDVQLLGFNILDRVTTPREGAGVESVSSPSLLHV